MKNHTVCVIIKIVNRCKHNRAAKLPRLCGNRMENIMKQIGSRIRKLRNAQGWTQGELAEKLEISPSTVGMYEQGRRKPDGEMLVKLCEVFSVSTDSLLGVSEPTREATDIIKEMSDRIRRDKGIMLNGAPMSEVDREKLLDAIEFATGVMLAKKV